MGRLPCVVCVALGVQYICRAKPSVVLHGIVCIASRASLRVALARCCACIRCALFLAFFAFVLLSAISAAPWATMLQAGVQESIADAIIQLGYGEGLFRAACIIQQAFGGPSCTTKSETQLWLLSAMVAGVLEYSSTSSRPLTNSGSGCRYGASSTKSTCCISRPAAASPLLMARRRRSGT